ncbi:HEAT repeat domain-containing protein [Streptomyces sp. 2R]|uniref:HEAT repeat domain-containing protein n=1 Tax=Streptomyces sp. 2R TaxID=1883452 RepID=UPI0015C64E90|nr:HEAT repeat domain-containing protein [Streptomyces sp. 2R]
MKFSKSHLDRLFKGLSSLPSRRFIQLFLEITSHAAGIHPGHHRRILQKAEELWVIAHHQKRNQISEKTETEHDSSSSVTIPTLQLQLELERTHRTADRLRWALSDAQALMTVLLQIVSALRDIAMDLNKQQAHALTIGNFTAADTARTQQLEALAHKKTAESHLARTNERRITLETLWEQAHGKVQRLSQHPEIADVGALPTGAALPQEEIVPLLRMPLPQLTDIDAALRKADKINQSEERKTNQWQQDLAKGNQPNLIDEHAILLAATFLNDAENRKVALSSLLQNWSRSSDTRDTLVRLASDDVTGIRLIAIQGLLQEWGGDACARQALIGLMEDGEVEVATAAVWALSQGWSGDTTARDALASLTHSRVPRLREIAVEGLREGWSHDATARDAMLPLTQDGNRFVREATIELLADGWPNAATSIRDALLDLLRGEDMAIRETAIEGLVSHWPFDPIVRSALSELLHDNEPGIRWTAEWGLYRSQKENKDGQSEASDVEAVSLIGAPGSLPAIMPARATGSSTPLIAARVSRNFETSFPLYAIEALQRGISFDPKITVIAGDNATGKTILLAALALNIGYAKGRQAQRIYRDMPLAMRLAQEIEILWTDKPSAEECLYLNHLDNPDTLKDLLAGPARHRLVLLDAPFIYESSARQSWEQVSSLADQGCQFVIVNGTRIKPANGKIIRFGSRRMRDSTIFPGRETRR